MRSRGAADARTELGRGRPGRGEGAPNAVRPSRYRVAPHFNGLRIVLRRTEPRFGETHNIYGGANRPSAIGEHALTGCRWRRLTLATGLLPGLWWRYSGELR